MLEPINIIETIRKNPGLYLGTRTPTSEFLMSHLVSDILVVDSEQVLKIFRIRDWSIVAADFDWLNIAGEADSSMLDYFNRAIPFPAAGRNTVHSEIFLMAFSTDIICFGPESSIVILGNGGLELDEVKERAPKFARCVAFRMGGVSEKGAGAIWVN